MPPDSVQVETGPWLVRIRATRLAIASSIGAALTLCLFAATTAVADRAGVIAVAALAALLTVGAAAASLWARRRGLASLAPWTLVASLAGTAVVGGLFASRFGGLSGMAIGVLMVSWASAVPLAPRRAWALPLGLLLHAALFVAVLRAVTPAVSFTGINVALLGAGLVIVTVAGRAAVRRASEDAAAWGMLANAQRQLELRRAELEATTTNLKRAAREQLEEALSHAKTTEQLDRLLAERVARRSRKLASDVDRLSAVPFAPIVDGVVYGRARILGRMSPAPYEHSYLATDTSRPGRQVLVVVVASEEAAEVEARLKDALGDLGVQHPSIAAVHETLRVGDGSLAVLSEHRPGRLLIHALARPDLSMGDALRLAGAIAEALAVAHARSIFHLGLDPYRVVLGIGQRGLSIYGLGLVQAWQRCGGEPSQSFSVKATPAYRSPDESSQSAGAETGATDVYALGVLAFEMLAKLHPFVARVAEDGSNAASTLKRVQPQVSQDLADLVEAMLSIDPSARPTMHQVALALRGFAAASGAPDVHAVSARLAGSMMMKAQGDRGAGQ